VLDYIVTSNHIHLLVKDTGSNVIAGMQLIAGRSAQEYNERKERHGAFWEDRYHASAIEADEHLHRCLAWSDPALPVTIWPPRCLVVQWGSIVAAGYGGIRREEVIYDA
jgi:hypothetical protein